MNDKTIVRVLFVCMGNICRSPTAHGVFKQLVQRQGFTDAIVVDSAGTHAYHLGDPPDKRAQKAAERRGVDLTGLRARRIQPEDYQDFDYILAMDKENLRYLESHCPDAHTHKLRLLLSYAEKLFDSEVPDPYYGGPQGFEHVLDLVEASCEGLLKHIIKRHFSKK